MGKSCASWIESLSSHHWISLNLSQAIDCNSRWLMPWAEKGYIQAVFRLGWLLFPDQHCKADCMNQSGLTQGARYKKADRKTAQESRSQGAFWVTNGYVLKHQMFLASWGIVTIQINSSANLIDKLNSCLWPLTAWITQNCLYTRENGRRKLGVHPNPMFGQTFTWKVSLPHSSRANPLWESSNTYQLDIGRAQDGNYYSTRK